MDQMGHWTNWQIFAGAWGGPITSFDHIKQNDLISDLDAFQNVTILNPLSQDLNVMRQSLLFSGLENVSYNINRKNQDLKFYEFGKTYHKIKLYYLVEQQNVHYLTLLY